jgi:hypothetical protein
MKFADAQRAAVAFLQSPAFQTRVHEEDPRMTDHLPQLLAMNNAGFLTQNSQPGMLQTGQHYKDGRMFESHERAFVTGFMQQPHAAAFMRSFPGNAACISTGDPLDASLDMPLTISLHNGKKTVVTHMSFALPKTVMASYRRQLGVNKDAVYVFCWDATWNRPAKTGLFALVLKHL